MARKFVDRGNPLKGVNSTVRDARVPYEILRSMENFALPDGRGRRRPGFKEVNDSPATILDNWLCKATGATPVKKEATTEHNKQSIFKTPLSYALLPYHADYKIVVGTDWTWEMFVRLGDHEPLVVNPFSRTARKIGGNYSYGGTDAAPNDNGIVLREPGVFLFDQTFLANSLTFDTGTIAANLRRVHMLPDMRSSATDQVFDSIPLTTLAIGFTQTKIFAHLGLVGKAGGNVGVYFPKEIVLDYSFGGNYSVGAIHHVVVRYKASTKVVDLLIDGISRDSYTIADTTNYGFIGEYDNINDIIYATGLGRDIVLLNECTVRASYSSTCRVQEEMHGHQTFFQAYNWLSDTQPAAPWCCSPPRGTAIKDLRRWSDYRTGAEITANKTKSLQDQGGSNNIVVNFPLNDGTGFCSDVDINKRIITLHHGYPAYVGDSELLHGLGLSFADCQHMIFSTKAIDVEYIRDIAAPLKALFGFDGKPLLSTDPKYFRIREEHGFTAQIQIRTPHEYPSEINDAAFTTYGLVGLDDTESNETRNSMEGSKAFNDSMSLFRLLDGHTIGSQGIILKHDATSAEIQYPRSFDMTLWSIEASTIGVDEDNRGDRLKVPLARGLITPAGKIAFEVYLGCGFDGVEPRMFRVISNTTLTKNNAYTLTFVKRIKYDDDKSPTTPVGFDLEIWIEDITLSAIPTSADVTHSRKILLSNISGVSVANPSVITIADNHGYPNGTIMPVLIAGTSGHTPNINGVHDATITGAATFTIPVNVTVSGGAGGTAELEHTLRSTAIRSKLDLDIIVGTSQVNSGFDRNISAPNPGGPNSGPWAITQHFMSPWQDQPGRFICGFFRLWASGLDSGDIKDNGNQSISSKEYTSDLLINAEIEEVAGAKVKNKARYPLLLDLGYKSWGDPQGFELQPVTIPGITRTDFIEPFIPGARAFEDGLGYRFHQGRRQNYTFEDGRDAVCRTLAPFQTTLTHAYGLIAGFEDHLLIDSNLDGLFSPLYIHAHGLLNEFSAKETWRGTPIGDRTILTSVGGIPKVYNGKNCMVAGFKRQQEGPPLVVVTALFPPKNPGKGLTGDRFYGIRVVYESEEYNIRQITDVATVKISGLSPKAISVFMIPPHYDPRVTSIRVFRTKAQLSEDFARNGVLFPCKEGTRPNALIPEYYISKDDSLLPKAPLDLRQSPLPNAQYAASLNGRLYLAGDPVVPDAVYFSDPGNPEKFDTLNNVMVLEEASGDKINGIISLFGVLVVFKANSIWIIEEVSNGQHQNRKVADLGALSDQSIVVVTMPGTGRTGIFFWSQHGPYMFDLSTLQYLGFGIEEKDEPTFIDSEFTFMDPTSVIALHDVKNKEVLFIYKIKTDADGVEDRPSEALVFNYRYRTWYRYFGMLANTAMSQTFTGNNLAGFLFPSGEPSPTTFRFTHNYKAYVGGTNGKIYEWAKSENDGMPRDETDDEFTVDSYNSGSRTITFSGGTMGDNSVYRYQWATIYRSSNQTFYSVLIEDNTSTTLQLLSDSHHPIVFDPAAGDTLYIALPPAQMEFPWDQLDSPAKAKEIVKLVTWHKKEFLFRVAKDWNDADFIKNWTTLPEPDVASGRKATKIKAHVEAIKLSLLSFKKQARVDAFGYEIDTIDDEVGVQPQG